MSKELDDFIASNKVAAVEDTEQLEDFEIDALLGLKQATVMSTSHEHAWPEAASGLESAGRRATPEEVKRQNQVSPSGIPVNGHPKK